MPWATVYYPSASGQHESPALEAASSTMVRGKKSFGKKVPRKDLAGSPSHSSEEEEESRCSAPSSRDSSPGREEEDTAVYTNLEAAAVIVEEVPPMEDEVDTQDTQRTSEEDDEPNTEDERRMDQEDELGDLRPVGSKRKRRAPQVMLPDAVEHEWLEHEVPYFYNKSLADYKNKAKQRAVLEEKGKTFNPPVTVEQMLQWLKTIRTRYVFWYCSFI